MKKHVFRISVGVLAYGLSVFTSCQKMAGEERGSMIGQDETNIETSEQQIDSDADEASLRTECKPEHFDGCATVIEEFPEGGDFPKIVTIDFGLDGECKGRKGKMIVMLTNNLRIAGAQRIVTFENFYHYDHQIEGTRVLENIGVNEAGNIVFNINDDLSISGEKGIHTRTRIGQKEWVVGSETEECSDDEFYLTGTETGTHCEGKSVTRTISEPVHIARSCKYPLSGIVEVEGGRGNHTLNFGDGTCDNKAIISSDKGAKEINLDELRKSRGDKKGRTPLRK